MTETSVNNKPYNDKVKVSIWKFRAEAYPFDNKDFTTGAAHYKSFGPTTDSYVPKSSAQEAMENGSMKAAKYRTVRRSAINFTSFFSIEKHVDMDSKEFNVLKKFYKPEQKLATISTYQKDYSPVFKKFKLPCRDADLPHPLFNRKAKNPFLQYSSGKFFDTELYEIPPEKKCNNYLRQIRNSHRTVLS